MSTEVFIYSSGIFVLTAGGLYLRTHHSRSSRANPGPDSGGNSLGMRNPDYSAFKARYRCEAPRALRELYENPEADLEGEFELAVPAFPKPLFVAYFMGMNDENMSLVLPGMEGCFAFASDGCSNRFLIDPQEADPVVYFYSRERRQKQSLKISLADFLALQRRRSPLVCETASAH